MQGQGKEDCMNEVSLLMGNLQLPMKLPSKGKQGTYDGAVASLESCDALP